MALLGSAFALVPGHGALSLSCLVIAIGLSPVMTFESEDAGEGPEDLLGTSQGSCFLTRLTVHCGDFYLLYFTAREAERSPQGVNQLSNREVTEKEAENDENDAGGVGKLRGKQRVRVFISDWEVAGRGARRRKTRWPKCRSWKKEAGELTEEEGV